MQINLFAAAAAVAAVAAAAAAAPAAAQDEKAPFTGPHVEAIIGADRVQGGGDHDTGFLYGVGAGWDLALGSSNWRLGAELEASDSTQKDCFTVGTDRACASAGRDLYAGARLGYVVGPRTMVYGKLGYTNARFKASFDSATPGASFSDGRNLDGIRVGAGIEQALSDNLFVKAEYRYSDYERGLSRHQVVTGVGYRF